MSSPSVSVIVPMHNGREILPWCLDSVPAQAELILVDDASTDGTADFVAERYPRALLIRNDENLGFGSTANRGLSAATGEVRVVLNSDARFRPGGLERLAQEFRDPTVGIAGPRLWFPDGTHQLTAASFPTVGSFVAGAFALNELYRKIRPGKRFRWQLALSAADHEHTQDVDWVKGACIAISRACFEATAGFDPGYRMYVEECDLCWRAKDLGWRVRYVADAHAEHVGGGSGPRDPARQARFNLAGEARFMERAYGRQILPRWRAARLASSALKAGLLAPVAPFDKRVRERLRWHTTAVRVLARASQPSSPR